MAFRQVRRWLSSAASDELPAALITDTNNHEHLERNVRQLPAAALASIKPGTRGYGHLSALRGGAVPSAFCLAPYGRGNGWEGRSASAVREGCIPISIAPRGSVRRRRMRPPLQSPVDASLLDGCKWQLRLAAAIGCCDWLLILAAAIGSCDWQLILAADIGSCDWL